MTSQEVILSACSSQPSSSTSHRPASSATPAIHLHDLSTASALHAFKTSVSGRGGVAAVGSRNGVGGTVWAVQEDKALVGVWAWQKDQQHMKLHLPEKISAITISPNGVWLAAGSPTGQLYLWEISSGLMLASVTAHYRAITSLAFSADSHLLISASPDTSAHVFLVSRLVDEEAGDAPGRPYGTLADHTLGITDVRLGLGGSGGGRCWTASEDGTVKVWSLHPPFDLLATFALPASAVPVTLAVDASERFFYVAVSNGEIFHFPMFRSTSTSSSTVEALGGGGVGAPPALRADKSVITLPLTGSGPKATSARPTALTLSMSSSQLLCGTSTGDIHIYDIPSHQLVRTISVHPGPVTHLETMIRPADLVGHSFGPRAATSAAAGSTAAGGSSGRGAGSGGAGPGMGGGAGGGVEWAVMDVRQPERMRVAKAGKQMQTAGIALRPSVSALDRIDRLRRPGHLSVLGGTAGMVSKGGVGAGKVAGAGEVDRRREEERERAGLVEENKRLRAALDRAVRINEKMWEGVVDVKMAKSGNGQNGV